MKWLLKAAVQKVISFLPYKTRVNFLFQKYVSGGYHLDERHFGFKYQSAQDHYNFLCSRKKDVKGIAALEFGTGWYPIVPLYLRIKGIEHVTTIDIYPHLTLSSFKLAIERMLAQDIFSTSNGLSQSLLRESLVLTDLDAILDLLNINYVLADITKYKFDREFDFICSNNTLEHIQREVAEPIIRSFKSSLKKDGFMSHFIDMSDHFSHIDPKIGPYNFLKYSPKMWRFIDNSIQPQNRFRFIDFKNLFETCGLSTIEEIIWDYKIEELEKIQIHSSFSPYSKEELAITHAYLISH